MQDLGMWVEAMRGFVSEALQTEFSRTCIIFSLAALLHSRQVRKEIKNQFDRLVEVLKDDLSKQSSRLGAVETRVERLETKGR
jgi:hypothetical protein